MLKTYWEQAFPIAALHERKSVLSDVSTIVHHLPHTPGTHKFEVAHAFNRAMVMLEEVGLLSCDDDGNLHMHQLVQRCIVHHLTLGNCECSLPA